MRIGMVCPYSFDVPGGVQSHVLQLAEVMRDRGHEVSVLAPSSPHVDLPDQLWRSLPFLLALVVLAGAVSRAHMPSKLTLPYTRGED